MFGPLIASFLGSPVFRWVAAGALALSVAAWLRYDAAQDARQEAESACRAAVAAAREEERQRQAQVVKGVLEASETRRQAALAAESELRGRVSDLLAEIEQAREAAPEAPAGVPPARGCALPADLVERLRAIR